MNIKRKLLFATLLFVLAACSAREQNGALPQMASRDRNAGSVVNSASAAACKLVPGTVLVGFDAFATQVAGASATDAWAVGSNLAFRHFNGSTWQSVPPPTIPNQPFTNVVINFVTPIASNDVWVGALGLAGTSSAAFFFHWNGSAWTYVPGDPTLTQNYQIDAMAGDASNNVWAAVHNSGVSTSFERWNGTQWTRVFSGPNSFFSSEDKMVVHGPNDVTAALDCPSNCGIQILHWNGASVGSTLLQGANGVGLSPGNFGGTSNNDLWLDANLRNTAKSPYIQHHSSSWAAYNTSLVNGYLLHGVVDFRPGYALIIATATTDGEQAALMVYNGYVRWRPTTSPWPTGAFAVTTGQIVKGTTSFWATFAVGMTSELGLVQCPSTPPAAL